MSQDNESSQLQVPWQVKLMVTGSANAIIFIFLATYNLFQASEHSVDGSQLQDSYHINCYLHTM